MLKSHLLACAITLSAVSSVTSPAVAAVQPQQAAIDQSTSNCYLQQVAPHVYMAPKGTTLHVILSTPITSQTATFGDKVNAILDTDIYAGKKLVVAKGSLLSGTVTVVDHARNKLKSKFESHRWLNAGAGIGFQLNTLKVGHGQTLNIDAEPAPQTTVDRAEPTADPLVVSKDGEVTPKGTAKVDRAASVAVTAAGFFGTPLTGMLLSGVAGAARPTYALGNGGALRSDHARVKGFVVGAVEGVPGVGIARQVFGHGAHVVLDTGDGVTVVLGEDLTIRTNAK